MTRSVMFLLCIVSRVYSVIIRDQLIAIQFLKEENFLNLPLFLWKQLEEPAATTAKHESVKKI